MARQLIYIGAGRAQPIKALQQRFQPSRTVLVEGQEPLASQLTTSDAIDVKQAWVSADGQLATFYHYNLAEFDGLLKASGLYELFPSLKVKASEPVTTTAITDLVKNALDDADSKDHVLVLDVPGQEHALLSALANADLHRRFEHIEVVTCQDAWFDGVKTTPATQALLNDMGFKATEISLSTDPDFPIIAGYRDALADENQELKAQVKTLQKQLDESKQAVAAQQKAHEEELQKQLTEAQEAAQAKSKAFDAQKEQFEAEKRALQDEKQKQAELVQRLQKQLDEAKAQIEEKQNQVAQLQERVQSIQQQSVEQISAITEKLDKLQISTVKIADDTTKKVTQSIKAAVVNSTKQLEAFMGVQQFLTTGQPSLDYHGWPISSDIAMYLLNKVQQENFDVIIEFGSGTSTVLFAKAIQQLQSGETKSLSELKRLANQETSNEISEYRDFAQHDLPKRVVTFEHNKTYHKKTTESLIAHQVNHLVDLVHAPLVDWTADGKDYLHYDCDDKLKELKHIFEGRIAKIMVFVDGPPGATCEQARYPAIPKILKHLAKHELHIVMDDYNRLEGKLASERWSSMIKERGLSLAERVMKLEKDGYEWVVNQDQ